MMLPQHSVQALVRGALAVVQDALTHSYLARAWELLQERDAEGNATGALPYTDLALLELEAAHKHNPDDVGIVHHLAIAHHAQAWDMELQGDPQAAYEWERALGYWRTVAASSEFWTDLKTKLLACDPNADSTLLTEARWKLLEDLLDVHVDFVRHYCETGAPEHATTHVEIVKRARIPPAVRKRMVGKVFDAMTGAVPEAKEIGAYDSALTSIERFLIVFPNYLSALRMYAEVCKEWVSRLSYQVNWADILRLSKRAKPHTRCLAAHPILSSEPLAQTALAELAIEFTLRGHDRSKSHFTTAESQPLNTVNRDAARDASWLGIEWGRMGYPHSPNESLLRRLLPVCLNIHALCLHYEAGEVMQSEADLQIRVAAALCLCRQAVAELMEAMDCLPDETRLADNLEKLRDEVSTLEDIEVHQ